MPPIYIHCPFCKTDQSIKNKKCKKCGRLFPKQKIYRVRVEHNGRVVTKTCPTLELARQIEAKIKAELVAGEYYDRRKRIPTLNEVWGKYLAWLKENKKGWKADLNRYTNHLQPRFGKKQLDKISPFDIERMMIELKKSTNARGKPYTPQTIKHIVALLRRIINKAIKWGLYDGDNPVSKVTLPKPNNELVEYLEPDQIKALWEVCENYHDKQAGNLVLFALVTGLRRGELFKLEWSDIDFDNGWLHIRNPKGGKDQILPLNQTALNILRNHPRVEDSPYVFPGKDGKMRTDFKTSWKRIKKLAGLPENFRFHGLRHVYATLLASSGQVNPYTLQKLLTHKDFKTTQRYSHLLEQSFKESAKVMDSIKGDNMVSVNFGVRKA
ncbi:MAG: site-specific integrase [Candidatus Desulfofervidaceae bacterium]|nr:site-specific integrase [Candidatus Desulfofervidaceae bacterium]